MLNLILVLNAPILDRVEWYLQTGRQRKL